MLDIEVLKKNIQEVFEKVELACQRSGRKTEEIKILGATKGVDVQTIRCANQLGIKVFGENRVQEFLSKFSELSDVEWHFIGRLQTNKIKYIFDKVRLIHSIDKLEQIEELEKRCSKIDKIIDVLIEVNIADEKTKGGVLPQKIDELIESITHCKYVQLKGFMAVPPAEDDEKTLRKYFRNMKEIFEKYKNLNYNNVNIEVLSLGMSNDFEIAIEEGSNLIRIGTKIFGERRY